MASMLHDEIARIDPKNATAEEMEKLLSDPLLRSLQYQLQNGVQDIKLETNAGVRKISNICIPDGGDQDAALQQMMAEDQKNKEREAKAEAPAEPSTAPDDGSEMVNVWLVGAEANLVELLPEEERGQVEPRNLTESKYAPPPRLPRSLLRLRSPSLLTPPPYPDPNPRAYAQAYP